MSRITGIMIICTSAFISFLLAITVDMSTYELGGLINFFWPPFIGLASILFFLICCWKIKTPKARIVIVALLSIYNIYIGLSLHLEKDYWPFVLF